MEFKVGDTVEVRNPEDEDDRDWHLGKVTIVDRRDTQLPYGVEFPAAADGSGWFWTRLEDIRPVSRPADIWQYKSRMSRTGDGEWVDLDDDHDGLTVVFSAWSGTANVTFRRKPHHTDEEILAELRRRDLLSEYDTDVSKVLRGEF